MLEPVIRTEHLSRSLRLCALVGVIRQGKLVALGSPDDLRAKLGSPQAEIVGQGFTDGLLAQLGERPEVDKVTLQNGHLILDLRGASKVGPLVSLVVQQGGEVEEVRKGAASLEDVFWTLMEEKRQ